MTVRPVSSVCGEIEQQSLNVLALPLETLRKLNQRFIHNFVTNDVPSLDAILHPQFRSVTPTGAHVDRPSCLRYWATGFDPAVIVYWDMRDERITLMGDTAFVGATNRWIRVIRRVETIVVRYLKGQLQP